MQHIFKKISGKIILVDDEGYEKGLIENALLERSWDIRVDSFLKAKDALNYLASTKEEIFLVISDMNMPGMTGLELKKAIDEGAVGFREKLIPFIFMSSTSTIEELTSAYTYRVQGFFKKPNSVEEQADMLDIIIKYWIMCRHPNKSDVDTKVTSHSVSSSQVITEEHKLSEK